MPFEPLTDESSISDAYRILAENITLGGEPVNSSVGYQGGSEKATVYWHPDQEMWILLQPRRLPSRYWCAFGLENPHSVSLLSITCEINPPRNGIDRRCAGLFIRDDKGSIFLAHSGRVGGGRAGIGQSAFMRSWGSRNVVSVRFPDRRDHDYILLGRLDSKDMLINIARFVHAVARFKKTAVK